MLFGHVHRNVEYRLAWDAAQQELRYFLDFYTENPATYYAAKKFGHSEKVHQRIRDVAVAGPVRPVRDNRPGAFWTEWQEMDIPRYADTLNDAADPARWWRDHRPLLCQTGALGPGVNVREDKHQNKQQARPVISGLPLRQGHRQSDRQAALRDPGGVAPARL